MKLIKNHILVFLIIIVASILRLYGLSSNPPHLTNDEAALGYNAYSILKTGRDEHGEFMPIVFKSFGDWKPGLYIYLTAPFIWVLGLNEFSTRIVGALSGIIAVLLVYLISQKLFNKKEISTFTALFLSLSPWHIQFSRGAWETNLALTLALGGIYFFTKSLENKAWNLVISATLFGLTLWAYQGAKFATFIIMLAIVLPYVKKVLVLPKKVISVSLLVGILLALPIALSFLQGKTGRLEVYSIFSYRRPEEVVQEIISQDNTNIDSSTFSIFHSENLNFTRGILSRYLNHFSGRFLFFEGDWQSPRHSVPNMGELLFIDIVLLLLGLSFLSKNYRRKELVFIYLWLVLAPLPAALSRDDVHAVRSFNMIIPLMFLLGFGGASLYKSLKKKVIYFPLAVMLTFLYIFNYAYFLDGYWVHQPKVNADKWHYGYKQMVEEVTTLQKDYKEIVIKQDYTQPYIFFLFYQKYDPKKYQEIFSKNYIPNSYGDVGLIPKLDNLTFRDINWRNDRGMKGKLFISDPIKVPVVDSSEPREFNVIDEIKYPNGKIAFRLIKIL